MYRLYILYNTKDFLDFALENSKNCPYQHNILYMQNLQASESVNVSKSSLSWQTSEEHWYKW